MNSASDSYSSLSCAFRLFSMAILSKCTFTKQRAELGLQLPYSPFDDKGFEMKKENETKREEKWEEILMV